MLLCDLHLDWSLALYHVVCSSYELVMYLAATQYQISSIRSICIILILRSCAALGPLEVTSTSVRVQSTQHIHIHCQVHWLTSCHHYSISITVVAHSILHGI